jgi:hypothetical protein
VSCRVPGLSVSLQPQALRRSSDGAVTIRARQWHTRAVVRMDVSVHDGARRRNIGLSAGQRWGTARGRPVDRNCADERPEAGAVERKWV